MKTIILAGGFGTRISEETEDKPKTMVLIGDKPILWHVMNIYAQQGFSDFVIATGYKSEIVEHWVNQLQDPWTVRALDTGLNTQTGGRIKQCIEYFPDERYFVTYGDGLGNINLQKLHDAHVSANCVATVTAVRPPARFGVLEIENNKATYFGEKPHVSTGWINGGFFVLEKSVTNFIADDSILFETGPLPKLARLGQLAVFKHEGFWKPMDTLREKRELTALTQNNPVPWLL